MKQWSTNKYDEDNPIGHIEEALQLLDIELQAVKNGVRVPLRVRDITAIMARLEKSVKILQDVQNSFDESIAD